MGLIISMPLECGWCLVVLDARVVVVVLYVLEVNPVLAWFLDCVCSSHRSCSGGRLALNEAGPTSVCLLTPPRREVSC